ncbi:hypothetical protein [Vibrio parahaemolyticus]|nr:hypothetical protein [Vibrio parahaemolyticus]
MLGFDHMGEELKDKFLYGELRLFEFSKKLAKHVLGHFRVSCPISKLDN